MKFLRVAPGLVWNLCDIRKISERDCGLYVTFINGITEYYADMSLDDVWDKLCPGKDYLSTKEEL